LWRSLFRLTLFFSPDSNTILCLRNWIEMKRQFLPLLFILFGWFVSTFPLFPLNVLLRTVNNDPIATFKRNVKRRDFFHRCWKEKLMPWL
jgi:hypothetical protein